MAEKNYKNYQRSKSRDVSILEREIQKIKSELSILVNKTIKFASNSRAITSKSYALGNSSYVELLQSEFKLQRILMQKVRKIFSLNPGLFQNIKRFPLVFMIGAYKHFSKQSHTNKLYPNNDQKCTE